MEKRKPTYDLDTIEAEFTSPAALRMTKTARDGAFALGLTLADVVAVIQGMTRAQFKKSMTSHADHRVWQEVDDDGHLLISFKEVES